MTYRSLKRPLLATAMLLVALMLGASAARPVWSQEPSCPPGFVWNRMSGVGCVQENCGSIANAKYSYTGSCICLDGYKACYEPVDYGGFDRALCGPHCPGSKLLACVSAEAPCPGDKPPPTAAPTGSSAGKTPDTADDEEFEAFLEALLGALAGGPVSAPTPGQAAAGGVAAGSLIGIWTLLDWLLRSSSGATSAATSGAPSSPAAPATTSPPGPMVDRIYDTDKAKKILADLGILNELHKLKRDDPNYWEKVDKVLEKVKNHRRVKGITYEQGPGGIDEDSIVIIVEEPEYGPVAPPPPPPTPTTTPTPVAPTKPVQPKPPVTKPVQPKPVPPKPPATKQPPQPPQPPPAPPPSTPGPHTFDDATPQQAQEIRQATATGLQQIDKAINALEAAKTAPDLLVGAYFDINGTGPDDRARLDGLIGKLKAMKQQIEKGVPFEVDDYGPVSFGWDTLKRGTIFARASGYVWTVRGYGKGIGDVHIVYPRWRQLSASLRAKVIVHEMSHYNTGTKDHAYSWQNKFWNLTQAEKLQNADSLAEFAMGIA